MLRFCSAAAFEAMLGRRSRILHVHGEICWRLALLGRANIKNYLDVDPETGQPTVAFKGTGDSHFYALDHVTVEDVETKRGRGIRTRIKLADRVAALRLLGMTHGMFKQDVSLNGGAPCGSCCRVPRKISNDGRHWRLSRSGGDRAPRRRPKLGPSWAYRRRSSTPPTKPRRFNS